MKLPRENRDSINILVWECIAKTLEGKETSVEIHRNIYQSILSWAEVEPLKCCNMRKPDGATTLTLEFSEEEK